MIIVEGPDGSGKSTLVKLLRGQLVSRYVINWNDPPKTIEELNNNLARSAELMGNLNVIQDRSPWITEPVYSSLGKGVDLSPDWSYYRKELTYLKPTLIYCRPPIPVIREHATTGNSPVDTPKYLEWIGDNIDELIQCYDNFMELLNPIRYDWTIGDFSVAKLQLDYRELIFRME
jgi:energy-coupling factor transporter ATP-binding protein EcfA2